MNAFEIAGLVRKGASGAFAVSGMVCAGMFAWTSAAAAESRGELLYTTHCIACHSTQIHWRDKRVATDWSSLKEQVRLWQGRNNLSWSEDDIIEVTRYLDQRIYRFGGGAGVAQSAGERR
jgi:hypothetical protein